jgi:hypothetical protein
MTPRQSIMCPFWTVFGALLATSLVLGSCSSTQPSQVAPPVQGSNSPPSPRGSAASSDPATKGYSLPAPGGTAGSFTHSWLLQVEETGGYRYVARVEFGDLAHSDPTLGLIDGGEELIAGSAGEVDPTTDAVVPGRITVWNATPRFPAQPLIHVGGAEGPHVAGPRYAEVLFTGGPDCIDMLEFLGGITVTSISDLKYGDHVSVLVFLIAPNSYTPDHPDGDPDVRLAFGVGVPLTFPHGSTDLSVKVVDGLGWSCRDGYFLAFEALAPPADCTSTEGN